MATKKKGTTKKTKLRNLPKKTLTAKQAKSVKGGTDIFGVPPVKTRYH